MITILYCIGLAVLIKFKGMDLIRDEKSGLIIVIAAVFGLFIAIQLDSIPRKLRARKQLAHLTGRAEGRITSHYVDTYETEDEDGDKHTNSRGTVIYYEFDVGGNTYTGQGYGSWKRANREHQTICYDPDHPEDNLPLYDIDSKTKTHFIGLLLYLVVSFAIFFGLIWLFFFVIYKG
ncbi:MAG: hypothetical protein J6T40_09875 [Clostridiales bacterium]|nr:hypothetical protein [Clostridiales bacterium]